MGISMFGNKPQGGQAEVEHSEREQEQQVEALKAEIFQARRKLEESEARLAELQRKLDEYVGRERQIAEIMIAAQVNAQKTEAQARARAEVLLQETDEELRLRQQEMELLRMKAQAFKDDLLGRLDQYKAAVEQNTEGAEDPSFNPTLIARETKGDHKRIG